MCPCVYHNNALYLQRSLGKPFLQGSPLSSCDREQTAVVQELDPAPALCMDQVIANGMCR